MDESIILTKLESLKRCVERIRLKTPDSVAALLDDHDLQDIITVNLERAVQICVDIAAHILADRDQPAPNSMGESFMQLHKQGVIPEELGTHLAKAVGFRNIAVHAYHSISWEIVFSLITERLSDFSDYARYIADNIRSPLAPHSP
ncbi:MAG: DUF86 domain-containing protein [Lentisphaerae bacterium]|nr:DUF86 domain-containing protein [Lentisphaerota bacterium]